MSAGELFDITYLTTQDVLGDEQRSWGLEAYDQKLYRLTHN